MFLTKKAISRRALLQGVGAAFALPLLDAMVPAATAMVQTPAAPVRRFGCFYLPNGQNPVDGQWTPLKAGTVGKDWEITPQLAPFEPFQDQLFIPYGLTHAQGNGLGDGSGDHARGCASFLTGVHGKRTPGPDVELVMKPNNPPELKLGVPNNVYASIDQIIARESAKFTKLASLETSLESVGTAGACTDGYACGYQIWFSWKNSMTPMHHEPNPRVIFERLFGAGGDAASQMARMKKEASILDSVTREIARLNKELGNRDKAILDEYMESIRDIERRIQISEKQDFVAAPALPDELPDTFEEHAKLILDLQVLAFQADITRVATTLIGREQGSRSYTKSGVTDGHHGTSHHQNDPEKKAKLTKITAYLMKQPAYLFNKLNAIKEGENTILQNSLFLVGGGLGDPNLHNHVRLPMAVVGSAGGNMKGGRSLRYPDATPASNLLLSMVQKMGLNIDKVGDSIEPLKGM
jgi:hypothetical protein